MTIFLWVMCAFWTLLLVAGNFLGFAQPALDHAAIMSTIFLVGGLLSSKLDKEYKA